jgi:hypothetical protein
VSSSSSSSTSELDVEQSPSSAKVDFVLPKLDVPVWETGPSGFPRLADLPLLFEHLIAILDLDQYV